MGRTTDCRYGLWTRHPKVVQRSRNKDLTNRPSVKPRYVVQGPLSTIQNHSSNDQQRTFKMDHWSNHDMVRHWRSKNYLSGYLDLLLMTIAGRRGFNFCKKKIYEAFRAFKRFKVFVEKEPGKKTKILRMDHGVSSIPKS